MVSVGATITRAGSNDLLTTAITGLPQGVTAATQGPGGGNTGTINLTVTTQAAAGSYPLSVNISGGTNQVTLPLTLLVGVVAVGVAPTSTGTFNEAMSTSFQPGYDQVFQLHPTATQPLDQLQSQHIRLQTLGRGIPQLTPDSWDFTVLDNTVQPVLGVADSSPEFQIADAPGFMYVPGTQTFEDTTYAQFATYAQNLVRYYNKGGFAAADGQHVSPSTTPITLWGIYNEPNLNGVTPAQYVQMYNALVPAMQTVDPSLKFVALELNGYAQEEQTYVSTFVSGVAAQVDVLATHLYSTCNQRDSDATVLATVPSFSSWVEYLYSQLKSNPRLATVPVWILENNVNADSAKSDGTSSCNPGQLFVTDLRGSSAFFAAWRPYVFSELGKAGAQALYQWAFAADAQEGEINQSTGRLQLSYWVDYWLARYFPSQAGGQMLQVTSTDSSDVETLAVKNPDGSVLVMVVDHAVVNATDNNGAGTPLTTLIDVSRLGTFSSATELTIDANTDVSNGPSEVQVAVAEQMQVSLGGYGVCFLKLKP
jgi:hypothetical protein